MKIEFSQQIFEKYLDIKFHENPFSWSRVVTCTQTDGQTWANSSLSQFCERAKNHSTPQTNLANNKGMGGGGKLKHASILRPPPPPKQPQPQPFFFSPPPPHNPNNRLENISPSTR